MSNFQQMLAARQAAVKEAQEAGAIQGHTTGTPKGTAADLLAGKVAVGLQGSVESAPVMADIPDPTFVFDEAKAKESVAVFKAIRLRKHIASDNTIQRPDQGYFYVRNEADVADFHHYAKYGLVEEV